MISVITPTCDRQRYLQGLYRTYTAQTYQHRELLVYDDSSVPSAFMCRLDDPTVRYFHRPPGLTIGEKRNWLIGQANGDTIAHFDDDDYYSPDYLSIMDALLDEHDFVKLIGWFLVDIVSGGLFYWDTATILDRHFVVGDGLPPRVVELSPIEDKDAWIRHQTYGYGFSYVYRRHLASRILFAHMNKGEDYMFATACEEAGFRLHFAADRAGIVAHILHGANSSRAFPNYRLRWDLFPSLSAVLTERQDVFRDR